MAPLGVTENLAFLEKNSSDNAERNTALLKSHKEIADKNIKLEENIKMVKRKSIIDTIVVMVNTFRSDVKDSITGSLELIENLSPDLPKDKSDDLAKLKELINSMSEQLDIYQNSSSISFDKNADDEKIIVFKKEISSTTHANIRKIFLFGQDTIFVIYL